MRWARVTFDVALERQNIGRLVDSPELAVEVVERLVVCQKECNLRVFGRSAVVPGCSGCSRNALVPVVLERWLDSASELKSNGKSGHGLAWLGGSHGEQRRRL